jgi:6-phosphogluconolactonase
MVTSTHTETAADPEALAEQAARWVVERSLGTVSRFALVLSGGSTPRRLYELLAAPPYRDRLPWPRVHLFWGDERFVPPDHPDSNFGMARQALLRHVPVPPGNLHAMRTDGTPEQAAAAYESELKAFYGSQALDAARPLFDATLLGLGADGHTASLFPGNPAVEEQRSWCVAVIGARPEPRLTLTLPALNSSQAVAFLVAGNGKRDILSRVWRGEDLPARRVRPVGELWWLIDKAAEPVLA